MFQKYKLLIRRKTNDVMVSFPVVIRDSYNPSWQLSHRGSYSPSWQLNHKGRALGVGHILIYSQEHKAKNACMDSVPFLCFIQPRAPVRDFDCPM